MGVLSWISKKSSVTTSGVTTSDENKKKEKGEDSYTYPTYEERKAFAKRIAKDYYKAFEKLSRE